MSEIMNGCFMFLLLPVLSAIAMGFSRSPPPYLSLLANAANSSREVMRNTTMAAAAAYATGANFASGGSGLLDSTVCPPAYLFHLPLFILCF
jgi:hypothetical protein